MIIIIISEALSMKIKVAKNTYELQAKGKFQEAVKIHYILGLFIRIKQVAFEALIMIYVT
jgi:hypothetical protein